MNFSEEDRGTNAYALWQACVELNHKILLLKKITYGVPITLPEFPDSDQVGKAIHGIQKYINDSDKAAQFIKEALEEERNKLIQEEWIKSQSSNLLSKIQGLKTLKELGDILLLELSSSVMAQMSAFYMKDESGLLNNDHGPTLRLVSHFGYNPESSKSEFLLGEGIVGQCALDRRPRYITDIPASTAKINTGFNDVLPKSLVIIPLIYENTLYGVLEFSSIRYFNELELRFLYGMAEAVGISIKSISGYMYTERLLSEIATKNNSLASQKQALDSSAIVAETDLKGRITYVNDKFLEISKYSRTELIGQDHRILNSKYHPKSFFIDLWKTIAQGQVWHGEVRNRAKDGSLYWVDTTIYPVKDEQGKLQKFVAIRFDVTDKKQVLEALQQATEAARQAAAVKADFLANMSHEIRTPMNAIVGMTDILQETMLNKDQSRLVGILGSASAALLDIINSILDISKLESGHFDLEEITFDLEELVDTTCEIMCASVQKNKLEFIKYIPTSLTRKFIGDPGRIRQVLINLISNAGKFTKNGEIYVAVAQTPDNPSFIEFSVRDTGIGIPEEKHGKLFKNFSQVSTSTSREYGGTGLGLSISKKIVEAMGGTLDFESTIGVGSRFYFRIPIQMAQESPKVPDIGSKQILKKRIIILDNNITSMMATKDLLSSYGAKPIEIENIAELKGLLFSQGGCDVLIVNITSDTAESAITEAVKDTAIEKIILLFNAAEQTFFKPSSISNSDVLYLNKPYRRTDLIHAITSSVAKEKINLLKPVSRHPPASKISSARKMRLLLADDVKTNLDIVKIYLRDYPIEIDVAENGEEAIKMFEKGSYDLVLMDIQMPIMDGRSATKQIREYEKTRGSVPTKIVALSAHATSEEISESIKTGCDGHILKPIKKKALIEAIQMYTQKNF